MAPPPKLILALWICAVEREIALAPASAPVARGAVAFGATALVEDVIRLAGQSRQDWLAHARPYCRIAIMPQPISAQSARDPQDPYLTARRDYPFEDASVHIDMRHCKIICIGVLTSMIECAMVVV
jgi:hypothetical protein